MDDPLALACAAMAAEPLALALGESDGQQFVLLDSNTEPTLVYGPQGGRHLLLGARVQKPILEFFSLDVAVTALSASDPCSEPCADWTTEGFRTKYVDDPIQYTVTDLGWVDIVGLLVVVDTWDANRIRAVRIDATDQCGRTGHIETNWYP